MREIRGLRSEMLTPFAGRPFRLPRLSPGLFLMQIKPLAKTVQARSARPSGQCKDAALTTNPPCSNQRAGQAAGPTAPRTEPTRGPASHGGVAPKAKHGVSACTRGRSKFRQLTTTPKGGGVANGQVANMPAAKRGCPSLFVRSRAQSRPVVGRCPPHATGRKVSETNKKAASQGPLRLSLIVRTSPALRNFLVAWGSIEKSPVDRMVTQI